MLLSLKISYPEGKLVGFAASITLLLSPLAAKNAGTSIIPSDPASGAASATPTSVMRPVINEQGVTSNAGFHAAIPRGAMLRSSTTLKYGSVVQNQAFQLLRKSQKMEPIRPHFWYNF